MVIHSKKYTKPQKSNFQVFRLENEYFVTVLNLINSDGTEYAEVEYLYVEDVVIHNKARNKNNEYLVIHSVSARYFFEVIGVEELEKNDIIKVRELKEKCVFVKIGA